MTGSGHGKEKSSSAWIHLGIRIQFARDLVNQVVSWNRDLARVPSSLVGGFPNGYSAGRSSIKTMTCTICRSPQLGDVNRALLAGDPVRDVAARFGFSKTAVSRHQRDDLAGKLASAKNASDAASSASLLSRLEYITAHTEEILEEARKSGDHRVALRSLARMEGQLKLFGEIVGLIQQQPIQVNIVATQEWVQVRSVIVAAVAPFPEAAQAVVKALDAAGLDADE